MLDSAIWKDLAQPEFIWQMTVAWCFGLVLILAVAISWHLGFHIRGRSRPFGQAAKRLRKLPGGRGQISLAAAQEVFPANSANRPRWEAYLMGWFDSVPTGGSSGAVDPRDHFEPMRILGGTAYLRKLEGWPGRFLSLGILGTFAGIALGLGGLSGLEQGINADKLFQDVTKLIAGLQTAFLTSIVGIVCSLAFVFAERRAVASATARIEEFLEAARSRFPVLPPEVILLRLAGESASAADSLRVLENDLAASLSESFGQAISQELAPVITSIQQTLEKVTDATAAAQVEGVERVIKKFMEGMDEQLGSSFSKLGDDLQGATTNLTAMSVTLDGLVERQRELLDRTSETARVLEVQLPHLMKFGERLVAAASTFESAITRVQQMEERFAEGSKQLIELQKATEKRFEDTVARLAELGELVQNTTTKQSEAQQRMEAAYKEALESFEANLRNGLVDSLKSFDGILGEVLERFSGTLADLREQYGAVERHTSSMQESLAGFSSSMAENLKEFERASGEAHKQIEGLLAEQSKVGSASLEATSKAITELAKSVEGVEESGVRATLLSEEMVKAAEGLRASIDGSTNGVSDTVLQFEKSTNSALAELNRGLGNLAERLGDFERSLKKAVEDTREINEKSAAESRSGGGFGRLFGRR